MLSVLICSVLTGRYRSLVDQRIQPSGVAPLVRSELKRLVGDMRGLRAP